MPGIVVIGGHWGDEGKGKIVDHLAQNVDMVVRFSGGDNAGHTVVNALGEFKLHLIPSGIFSNRATCIIGNGVVLNPEVFLREVEEIGKSGVDTSRLYISDRAHIVMPYHTMLDGLEEQARGANALGTTRKGIGPAYADKAARMGIRAGDLLDKAVFLDRLRTVLKHKNAILTRVYGVKPVSLDEVYSQFCTYGEKLAPRIKETSGMIEEAFERGDTILLEGAQGALLDPDFGTYPYTTSSSPLAGASSLGSGLSPLRLSRILGVFKVYCTRVGGGPLPTEISDEMGDLIRERGHEYGATTGRPRRCGWFDAVAARLSVRINGFTDLAITRLDILDTISTIKICTAYELDGRRIDYFPASAVAVDRCRPIYEEMPGWETPTTEIRQYRDLPLRARQYVARLSELLAAPVSLISVGQRPEQTVQLRPLF